MTSSRASWVACLAAALAQPAAGAEPHVHRKTGKAIFIGGAADKEAGKAALAGLDPRDWLELHGPAFGLAGPETSTSIVRDRVDEHGRSTRFQQHYRGLPVFGGEVIVNSGTGGRLKAMTGRASPDLELDIAPALDAQEASAIALAAAAKWHRANPAKLVATTPVLAVYDPRLVDGGDAFPPALVWRVEVRAADLAPIDHLLLLDANTGEVRLHFNQVDSALTRITYDASSGNTLPGTLVCDETNPTCAGGIADAVNAHTFVVDAYNYFLTQHGRDSYDGLGSPVVQTVRYCDPAEPCPFQNAFWSQVNKQIVYGANYPKADDIVAHEFAHGVQRAESNLFQYYQSGSINESLSDVWGEFVDQTNGKGTDTATVKWRIGEDLGGSSGIRNMADPPLKGDPDRMLSPLYATGPADGGEAHANAGINNKAAFLMTDGGTFNGRTIAALGMAKVAKVYYRAETALLVSGSDYLDLYNALYQACSDLVGTSGITAADCTQVRNATEAVEMHFPPAASFIQAAPVCPAGQAVATVVLNDDLEPGRANWTFTRVGTSGNWSWNTGYASSGVSSLVGPNGAQATDIRATTVGAYAIPANAWLWFSHAFGFEHDGNGGFHDGGVVEYSTDGGATWIDAGPLFAAGRTYGGTLASPSANALAGRSAFVAESHGYGSTRYSLATLSGQSIRLRFRVGTDDSVSSTGWRVDDIRIHTCAAEPAGTATMAFSPGSIAFGAQSMGTTSAPREAVVINTGTQALNFSSITIAGGQFSRTTDCTSVAPKSSCSIQVAFSPSPGGGALNSTVNLAATLTLASNSSTGGQSIALTGTAEKSLVTHYYRSALRRDPDAGGKAFWQGEAARVAGAGANVNETWFAMAQAFYTSPEYSAFNRDNAGFATDLYGTFFNRAPDAGGLAYWKGQLDSGLPREVALAAFMFSPEFVNFTAAIFGGNTARAEVNAVLDFYRGLLARLPDDGGLAYWVGRFRAAQCSGQGAVIAEVEAISSAFTLSGEYAARGRGNAQYVGDLYNAFLRRGGDLAGVQFWIGQVATGTQTREQVRVQFRNSPEFQARVSAVLAQGCL